MKLFLFLIGIFSNQSFAAETEYQVDPIWVSASASFDSLSDVGFLPQKKFKFNQNRNSSQEVIDKTLAFPSQNYGYPSGVLGNNLGGRSVDDAQVSTLGVPLNLPQGGGPDLSIFPSFLWSGANYSMVPQLGGYSPQGVSGGIQFDLWSRSAVREFKKSTTLNRVTGNMDRNLQTISIASKVDQSAILGGMSLGRQTGPSGSLSLYAIRKPKSHLLFHLLGSDQVGENPGSKSLPTPKAKKKFWRIIPVLESHQEFNADESSVIWESTLSGDLQQLQFEDSDHPGLNTSTRTQQIGLENAIKFGDSTIGLTARSVHFESGSFGNFQEWPLIAQYSHDFSSVQGWNFRLSGGGNFLSSTGFVPNGRVLLKQNNEQSFLFFELHSLNKMPSLNDRHYVLPGFVGNTNLSPERVNGFLAGFVRNKESFQNTLTIKTEYRNQIQVQTELSPGTQTLTNSGNAWLISMMDDFEWKPASGISEKVGAVLTASKVSSSGLSYPDLPLVSLTQNGSYGLGDDFEVRHHLRWIGDSKTASGAQHPGYFLADLSASYEIKKDIVTTIGCDNVFDSRAEVILDYPLPGRIAYMNVQINL
jgi:outer membrane receptor protein involved in Fe transport